MFKNNFHGWAILFSWFAIFFCGATADSYAIGTPQSVAAFVISVIGGISFYMFVYHDGRVYFSGKAIKVSLIPKEVICRVIDPLLTEEYSFVKPLIIVQSWRKKTGPKDFDYRILEVEDPSHFIEGLEFERSVKFTAKNYPDLDKNRFFLDGEDTLFEVINSPKQATHLASKEAGVRTI